MQFRVLKAYRPHRLLGWLLVFALAPLAGLSLYRGATNAVGLSDSGMSIDLHSYWNPGRLVLKGMNPYPAVLAGELDAIGEAGLANVPANAPLMLLILSPLSALSWSNARLVWMVFNIGLALALPLVISRLVAPTASWWARASIVLVFWAMLPTRNVISNGQTSLFAIFATLLAVLAVPRSLWLAGLLFGLALSKYSLVLPVTLWFLLLGYPGAVVVALATQVLAGLVLSAVTVTSPVFLASGYYSVATLHTDILGDLDLASLVTRLGLSSWLTVVGTLIGIVLTVTVLFAWYRPRLTAGPRQGATSAKEPASALLLALLLILPLPFVYHRVYDAIVLIMVPIAFISFQSGMIKLKGACDRGDLAVPAALSVAILSVFLMPRFILVPVWPTWEDVYPLLTTSAAVAAWGLTLWYVWHTSQVHRHLAASA